MFFFEGSPLSSQHNRVQYVRRQQNLLDFIKFTLTLPPTQGLLTKEEKLFVYDDAIIKFMKKIFPRSRSLDESNRFLYVVWK